MAAEDYIDLGDPDLYIAGSFYIRKPVRCRYCGSDSVYWYDDGTSSALHWRLYDCETQTPHLCNRAPKAVDDFGE